MKKRKNDPEELSELKSRIDLCEYAAYRGFVVDKKKTTERSAVMTRGNEQIVISIGDLGYYIYFKRGPYSKVDKGTIIDFVQSELGFRSIGKAREALRDWLTWDKRPKINPNLFKRIKKKSSAKQLDKTKAFLELWDIDDTRSYVEGYLSSKKIPKEIVFAKRFKEHLRTDQYNNIIFPHFLGKDVIGWEIKNHKFTGYLEGAKKSVWFSNRFEEDDTLIITGSGIEALSFYTLYPEYLENAWCLATAGGWSKESEKMLQLAIKSFPNHTLILGFTNDVNGEMYEQEISALHVSLKDERIPIVMKPKNLTWNQDLVGK